MEARKRWLAASITVLLLGGLALLLWQTGFFEAAATPEGMEEYIRRFSPYSHLVFFLIQLTTVILAPIPSNLTAAAGGLLFGTVPAFLLTFGAVVLGSVIVFLLARWLGQRGVERLISTKGAGKYLEYIRTKRDTFLAMALLFPFFPDDLLCILAGLTDIPLRRFVVIVLLTRPWGLLLASALGGSALNLPLSAMITIGIAGVGLFFLGLKYGDRIERRLMERFQKKT